MSSDAPRLSMAKDKIQILLLEGIAPEAQSLFAHAGYRSLTEQKGSLMGDELQEALAKTHILGIRSRTQLTAEVLAAAPKLLAVGCFCIGTNQVNLAVAQRQGVPVFNAPFSNTRSVAELVIAQIIMLMRGIPQRNAAAHRGEWLKNAEGAYEIRGKTLGIVGYGHIGTQLGVLAESLGMKVLFHDIQDKLPLGNAAASAGLSALLSEAEVVSLHVPQTPETRQLIGSDQLRQMQRGAWLINASRGEVVDIDALAGALESGHLRGAAIDVFPTEPKTNRDVFQSPLRGLDNVILTPHIGGSTAEAQQNIAREVAAKLIRYSDNGSTVSAVNFPEVAMPDLSGRHRLLHIHHNAPGVLNEINQLFSAAKVNITGQYLQTSGDIGYVVMDVEQSKPELLAALRNVKGTIRSRVLY